MSIPKYREAHCFYEEAARVYQLVDPLQAATVVIKQAKCMMYSGRSEDAVNFALLGIQQKRELQSDEDDLAYSLDDCASVLIGCNRTFDVVFGRSVE